MTDKPKWYFLLLDWLTRSDGWLNKRLKSDNLQLICYFVLILILIFGGIVFYLKIFRDINFFCYLKVNHNQWCNL
jgi:hypothetical protein